MDSVSVIDKALELYFGRNPHHDIQNGEVVNGNGKTAPKALGEILTILYSELQAPQITMLDITSHISRVESELSDEEVEVSVMEAEEINDYTANTVLWWLRVAVIEDQSVKLVVRTCSDTNTYSLATGGKGGLGLVKTLLGIDKTLLVQAKEALNKGFESKNISYIWKYTKDNTVSTPSLSQYLDDNLDEIIGSELMALDDKIVGFSNDTSKPAFAHVDLNKMPINPLWATEGFYEALTIMNWIKAMFRPDQAVVFMAYLSGVMHEDFKSRQGLYIEDLDGNSGKSTFMEAYMDYLRGLDRNLVASMTSSNMKNQFVYSQFYGKRVIVDSDVKNIHILHTEVYHKITGGDMVSVEMKGQDIFTARVKCFPIMMGNISLEINTAYAHERSRIIYLKAQKLSEEYLKTQCIVNERGELVRDSFGSPRFRGDNGFKEKIREEMPVFLQYCRLWYDHTSGGAEVSVSDDILNDLDTSARSAEEEIYDKIFEEELDLEEGARYPARELRENLSEYFEGRNGTLRWKDFVKYLEVQLGVVVKNAKMPNTGDKKGPKTKAVRCYIGIKQK